MLRLTADLQPTSSVASAWCPSIHLQLVSAGKSNLLERACLCTVNL